MLGVIPCPHGDDIDRCPVTLDLVAFETAFLNVDCWVAFDLQCLEAYQGTYENFVELGVVWVPFRPHEVIRYAQGAKALADAGVWAEEIGVEAALDRVRAVRPVVASEGDRTRLWCAADFLGPDIESLVCGGEPERYFPPETGPPILDH